MMPEKSEVAEHLTAEWEWEQLQGLFSEQELNDVRLGENRDSEYECEVIVRRVRRVTV